MIYFITNQQSLFELKEDIIKFSTVLHLEKFLEENNEIDFDTETEGLDPYTCGLISAQFGTPEHQFVVDCTTVDICIFRRFFEDSRICWNMQNAKFDLQFLYHKRIVPKVVWDTLLAESVLNMGIPFARKALDFLAAKYCNIKLDKSIRGKIQREGLTHRVIKYAADDVTYLKKIKTEQLKLIKKEGLEKALLLENLYVRVLAYIEYSGFKLNAVLWKEKMKQDNKILKEREQILNNYIIDNGLEKFIDIQLSLFSEDTKCNINWASSHQVIVLFKELGINTEVVDKKTGKLKHSVEATVVSHQKDEFEIIKPYLQYKAAEKVVSTYGQSFLDQISSVTGRIHTNFKQLMDTGRLSSGGGLRKSINFQNIPALPKPKKRVEGRVYARNCFYPEEGYSFVVNDYSGQEQIVLANQSMDKDLLAFYDNGLGDMHSYNASKIFPHLANVSLQDIKDHYDEERQLSKGAGFAINYGGNGLTIARNANISDEKGNEIYSNYLKAFPGLVSYWDKAKKIALTNGYILINPISNRKSYISFFDNYKELEATVNNRSFWSKYREEKEKDSWVFNNTLKPQVKDYFKMKGNIERKALNFPVQGTSAEITKLAGIYLFERIEKEKLLFKVWMPNVIHDEIMLEAPDAIAKEVAVWSQKCMERAGERFYTRVKLTATPFIGKTWEH